MLPTESTSRIMLNENLLNRRRQLPSSDHGEPSKRSAGSLYGLKLELGNLCAKKSKWLDCQRKASLLVEPFRIDEHGVMAEASQTPTPTEEHGQQLQLIQSIVQESIIIEWPRRIHGLGSDFDLSGEGATEVDYAPLIHRARNVVKCRTSHPTMRVRICAIGRYPDDVYPQPKPVEAFFRATLVKISGEIHEQRQVAGRLILTQREGTPATKSLDQNGATVNSEGQLIATQAQGDTVICHLMNEFAENGKTTPFKFEQGALCATFPEMGVTLNSMIDRRQLATRYAIQVEVALNIDNKLIVRHTVLSHPFLIAITNDQTEPLLLSIFWQRLLNSDQLDTGCQQPETTSMIEHPPVSWKIMRQVLRNFVKAQFVHARCLELDELYHLQCMLFLPRALICGSSEMKLRELEIHLFGDVREDIDESRSGIHRIKYRLLRDEVRDEVLVEKRELMQEKCLSLVDCQTELKHNLWQWLYRATEMIIDVGHKLCPSPMALEKKGSKTKKQMAASEEYQTMLSLFNNGVLTFSSLSRVYKVFKSMRATDKKDNTPTSAILIRFCDESASHLSLSFTNADDKPLTGPISAEQIKDYKQGLAEVLMDEPFPKKFERLVKFESKQFDRAGLRSEERSRSTVVVPRKERIFTNYLSMRLKSDFVQTTDPEAQRRLINPVTGERMQMLPNRTVEQVVNLASILPIPPIVSSAGQKRSPLPPSPMAMAKASPEPSIPPQRMPMPNRLSMEQQLHMLSIQQMALTSPGAMLPLFSPLMANSPSLPSIDSPMDTHSAEITPTTTPMASPTRQMAPFQMPSQFSQLPTQVQVETIASVLAADLHNRHLASIQFPSISPNDPHQPMQSESPPPSEPEPLNLVMTKNSTDSQASKGSTDTQASKYSTPQQAFDLRMSPKTSTSDPRSSFEFGIPRR